MNASVESNASCLYSEICIHRGKKKKKTVRTILRFSCFEKERIIKLQCIITILNVCDFSFVPHQTSMEMQVLRKDDQRRNGC